MIEVVLGSLAAFPRIFDEFLVACIVVSTWLLYGSTILDTFSESVLLTIGNCLMLSS